MTPQAIVEAVVTTLDEKKAQDIVVLDVKDLTSLGDHFVIASGNSTTQVKALAGEVEKKLHTLGVAPLHVEGTDGKTQWILLDYGTVLVHIFFKEMRAFYDLERLWADAPEQNVEEILQAIEKIKEKEDQGV